MTRVQEGKGLVQEGHQFGSSQGMFTIWQALDIPMLMRFMSMGPPLHWSKGMRLALTAGMSISNTGLGLIERLLYSRRIERYQLSQPPVFIIGHWRSGTTLLHGLLSRDPQFICPNLYQVLSPHHFLLTESVVTRLTEWMLPKTRPMDNIRVTWDAPQEDEMALCTLTLLSPYLMLAFQGQPSLYQHFWDMRQVSPRQLALWKTAFMRFLKKLTLKNNKTLLLKSPTHTFRIPLLLEMFPGAKFINIVRNPYAVYSSSIHLRKKLFEANGLGKPNFQGLENEVLQVYTELFKRYEIDRHLLSDSQLCEMKFEDLEQDPIGELRKVYEQLNLSGFDALETDISSQLDSLRKYRKNEFTMDEELMRRVYQHWEPVFTRYQYSKVFASSPAQVA
jgi:omega-hydroxy-beta-dihydromenaquinone-9 sulfotransferase